MTIYCCCIICKQIKSTMGIHSHYICSHTIEGKKRIQKNGILYGKLGGQQYKNNYDLKSKDSIKEYKLSPKTCKECNALLDFQKRKHKFCSKSCAAININKNRKPHYNLSEIGKENIKFSNRKRTIVNGEFSKVYWCTKCKTPHKSLRDKFLCCKDSVTKYRPLCKFTFNLKDYPEEFDLTLLVEFGMFSPKKNPNGLSRDHMVSIDYAFKNKIDPSIIRHPANCKLIFQKENSKKHTKNEISLDELLDRIKFWDNKYNSK